MEEAKTNKIYLYEVNIKDGKYRVTIVNILKQSAKIFRI